MLLSPNGVGRCKVNLGRIVSMIGSVGRGTTNNILCRFKGRFVIHNMLSAGGIRTLHGTMVGGISRIPVALRGVTRIGANTGTPGVKLTSRHNGTNVLLAIAGRPGADALSLANGLSGSLRSLRGMLPGSIGIAASVFHRSHFVGGSVSGIRGSLCRNNVFMVVMLLLFLVGVHAAIVSLVAVPLSIVMTVLALGTLKLAVGAVDLNNVTVTVNSLISSTVISIRGMFGHLQRGERGPGRRRGGILAIIFRTSGRMHVPVLGSALVVMTDFIPLFFLSKVRNEVLTPLNVAFIVSLFTSAIITLALAPILYDCLLGGPGGGNRRRSPCLIHGLGSNCKVTLQ